MILADISTSNANVALWFAGLSCLVAFGALVTSWTRKSQRREIVFAGTPVDKKDFDEFKTAITDRMGRLEEQADDDKTEILRIGETRASKTHERIDQVLAAVSELRGIISQLNERMRE